MASSSSTSSMFEKTLTFSDISKNRLRLPRGSIQTHIKPYLTIDQIQMYKTTEIEIVVADKDIGDMYVLKFSKEGIHGWGRVVRDKNLKIGDHLQLEYDNNVLYMKFLRISEQDSNTDSCLFGRRIQKALTDSDASQYLDSLSLPRAYILSHIVQDLDVDDKKLLNEGGSLRTCLIIDDFVYELRLSIEGLQSGWGNIVLDKNLNSRDHIQLDYGSCGPSFVMKILR